MRQQFPIIAVIKTPRHRATHPPPAKDGSSSDLTQCASTRQYIQLTSRLRSRRHTRRQSAAKKGSHHPRISAHGAHFNCADLSAHSPQSPLAARIKVAAAGACIYDASVRTSRVASGLSAHHVRAARECSLSVCVYNAPMFRLICRCLFNKKRNSFA